METILVATDFSPAAGNAMRYAASLAKKTGSKLLVMNVYHPPVLITEGAVLPFSMEEMKKEASKKLRYALSGLRRSAPNIKIESLSVLGLAADEIERVVREKNINLLVLGIESSNTFSEKFFGSTATTLMVKSACPVLTVRKNIKFQAIKNILIAADYSEYWPFLPTALLDLARVTKAHLHILHINATEKLSAAAIQKIAGKEFHQLLQGLHHSFHTMASSDIVGSISNFAKEHKIDLVVMNPHKHSFIEKLFVGSKTEKMAFHSELPLFTYS